MASGQPRVKRIMTQPIVRRGRCMQMERGGGLLLLALNLPLSRTHPRLPFLHLLAEPDLPVPPVPDPGTDLAVRADRPPH